MDYLQELLEDYSARKQGSLLQLKKGILERERFLEEAREYISTHFTLSCEEQKRLLTSFEQYIFGYSILTPLMDDPEISDIRVISYRHIRVKRCGQRMEAGIAFASEKEYRHLVDAIATRNQVNISHLNAIQRFTDTQSHPDYILRFTISMPLLNAGGEPYLCIRKIPRKFPGMRQLIEKGVLTKELAELLVLRFGQGSTLICGGNSSGKTTLLNALKEICRTIWRCW